MNTALEADRIRGVCFDIDGTLIDTDDLYVRRIASRLESLPGFIAPDAPMKTARNIVYSLEGPTNAVAYGLDVLHLDGISGRVLNGLHSLRGESRPGDYHLIPGVSEMLHSLSERFSLAIVTARESRSTADLLQVCGLKPYFRYVATARTCHRGKPHPAPIYWVAGEMGVSPSELVMVGDTTLDIRAGVAAGAQTVGVLCGFGERDELENAGASAIVYHTPDLVHLL
jgi:HAD superfamily hydrolase (TIGR01509 family)